MHAHACVVWVELARIRVIRLHSLSHLEEGVHLLLGAHLVPKYAVVAHIARLVDV